MLEESYYKIKIRELNREIERLINENFELSKRIRRTKRIVDKVKKVNDYMNGIACDDLLIALEGKENGKIS